jgi:hypothetical protein
MTLSCKRALIVASLCALALGEAASCSNPAGPPSGECTRETVFNGRDRVPANNYIVQRVTTTKTGRLSVTMDWVLDSSVLSLVLAQGPCSLDQFKADQCNVISDLFPPPKPLQDSTTWLNPGDYDMIIGNFTPADEIASIHVEQSSTGCETP